LVFTMSVMREKIPMVLKPPVSVGSGVGPFRRCRTDRGPVAVEDRVSGTVPTLHSHLTD
jgi:hypothetical protein